MHLTETISDKQRRLINLLIISFQANYNHVDRKIKSSEIVAKLRDKGISSNDVEVRDMIRYIRRNDLCEPGFILADNDGFWLSYDTGEMEKVWRSNHGRAIEIYATFKPLYKRFKHLVSEIDSMF